MNSNFEKLERITKEAGSENFSCLFHVEPGNLPRWPGPFVKKKVWIRSFRIREKYVMNSLIDWRHGPAQYWYDMLGLPEKIPEFDYGLKNEVSESSEKDIKIEEATSQQKQPKPSTSKQQVQI